MTTQMTILQQDHYEKRHLHRFSAIKLVCWPQTTWCWCKCPDQSHRTESNS